MDDPWAYVPLRQPMHDSQHSRRIPTFRLKNYRTFALFTTAVHRAVPALVIGVNVRRNQPQGSNVGLNVRLSNEPSRLYYSGGGRFKAMNGNLFCIFSTEKYLVIRKRGRQVEV